MCAIRACRCANPILLNGTLRTTWRFDGCEWQLYFSCPRRALGRLYRAKPTLTDVATDITSDCGAVRDVGSLEPFGHGFTHGDMAKAGGAAVAAGTDVDCGHVYGDAKTGLNDSINRGYVTQAKVCRISEPK